MKTAEDILKEKNKEMICISPDTSIFDAARTMVVNNIGAVIVKEDEIIHGIYTERDYLHDSVKSGFDTRNALVRDYMTCNLIFASHDDPIYKLQDMMLGMRIRHLLIQKDKKYIGLLSAGDVTRASLNESESKLKSVSWNYYEDWKWKKK